MWNRVVGGGLRGFLFITSQVRKSRGPREARERTCRVERLDLAVRDGERDRRGAAASSNRGGGSSPRPSIYNKPGNAARTTHASDRARWKFDIPRSSDLMSPERGVSLGYALALCHAPARESDFALSWGGERGEKIHEKSSRSRSSPPPPPPPPSPMGETNERGLAFSLYTPGALVSRHGTRRGDSVNIDDTIPTSDSVSPLLISPSLLLPSRLRMSRASVNAVNTVNARFDDAAGVRLIPGKRKRLRGSRGRDLRLVGPRSNEDVRRDLRLEP